MPEKPILIFPTAKRTERSKRHGGGGSITFPTPAQQRQRLESKFRNILASFAQAQPEMAGIDPERVIVLEVIGDVGDLAKSAQNVPGLEWLAEIEEADTDQGEGFTIDGDLTAKLPLRLFAFMTNQQAMQALIGLWSRWLQNPNERAGRGFGPFKNVFKQLLDLRLWGPRDRLQGTGVLQYWLESVQLGVNPVRFQAELWCRQEPAARDRAYGQLELLARELGGQCVRQRTIPEIMYHGVLLDIPRDKVEEAVKRIGDQTYTALLRCGDVMLFRPSAQMASPLSNEPGLPFDAASMAERAAPSGVPVVALLDGCPLENHVALVNRLIFDDPDGLAAAYAAGQQQHGTAMASLIAHGDLSSLGDPLPRPVYVRPIFVPTVGVDSLVRESMPTDHLPLDVIERAVRRIFEGDGDESAAAPSVRVISLSIGDSSIPFDREISPLARLLDWLAWKYNVLFVVSCGNQVQDIVLGCTRTELAAKTPAEIVRLSVQAIYNDQHLRRPFSPAEAINVLTVGALHADDSGSVILGYRRDLFSGHRMPSPICTISGGFRRSVKPEILMAGGRQLYDSYIGGNDLPASFRIVVNRVAPGQQVAAPGVTSGNLSQTAFSRGTSNATALTARAAAMIHDRLKSLVNEPGGERLTEEWMAVLLKTLLVHGASWSGVADIIEQAAPPGLDWRAMATLKRRLLGYGEAQPARSLAGDEKRVLLLGWDSIHVDEGHEYVLPLPPSLASKRYKRRLTVSLGWITPVNQRHRAYRRASLFLDLPAPDMQESLGLRSIEVDRNESARGTTQHLVFEGEEAIPFVDGAGLTLKVNCRADAGKLEVPVRYAMAVTLEVADPIQIDIHAEILPRIRARAVVEA